MITFSDALLKRQTGMAGNALLCVFIFSSKDKKSGEFIQCLLCRVVISPLPSAQCGKTEMKGGKKAQDSNYRECSQSWNSQR